jgi:hypothetical protein
MDERRREPRLRALLGGRIRFRRLQSTMDCIVRSIAPHGAMLQFPQTAITPSEFSLHIPQRGETHSARVVWRRQDRLGVELSHMEKTGAPVSDAERIGRLRAENRRRQRQLDPTNW